MKIYFLTLIQYRRRSSLRSPDTTFIRSRDTTFIDGGRGGISRRYIRVHACIYMWWIYICGYIFVDNIKDLFLEFEGFIIK